MPGTIERGSDMSGKTEISIVGQTFEGLKQVNKHAAEYWSARALQPLLGYSQWRRFEQAIEHAITSCKESGNPHPSITLPEPANRSLVAKVLFN